MEAQGYRVGAYKLYQDNMSAILLEKNGKTLIRKRTTHINIPYFFVKDRVNSRDM